jgi:DNA-binding GntR family transcriptional regulator
MTEIRNIATATRAAAILRWRILSGELPPGSPLREAALSKELSISRNTLREAFQQLSIEGLTEQQLYKGTVVRRIGEEELKDIFIVRRTFELQAIAKAPLTPGPALDALRDAVDSQGDAAARQAWAETGTASLRFHQAIVGLLGSRKLDSFFEVLAAQLRLAFSEVINEATFQAPWVPRDREMYFTIRAGDRVKATAAMESYLNDSERILSDVLRATQPERPQRKSRSTISPELRS